MDEESDVPKKSEFVHRRHQRKKWLLAATISLLLLAIASSAYLIYSHKNTNPLADFKDKITFPIYMPKPLPEGYAIEKNSIKLETPEQQVLFFNIRKQSSVISISEQAVPDSPPDLQSFKDFKKLNVLNGDGIIGRTNNKPTALILTNTTLIILTTSKNTPNDSLIQTAENLKLL